MGILIDFRLPVASGWMDEWVSECVNESVAESDEMSASEYSSLIEFCAPKALIGSCLAQHKITKN